MSVSINPLASCQTFITSKGHLQYLLGNFQRSHPMTGQKCVHNFMEIGSELTAELAKFLYPGQ